MRHGFKCPSTCIRQTPLRLLITQFPDLAKQIFDKCLSTNLRTSTISGAENSTHGEAKRSTVNADDENFKISFNYELLDDSYVFMSSDDEKTVDEDDDSSLNNLVENDVWKKGSIWDENGKLLPKVQTYCEDSGIIKANHPLMIMVKEQKVVSFYKLSSLNWVFSFV